MLKVLVSVAFIWLSLGAAGALMIDLERPARLADVALGPITLGEQLLRHAEN